MVYSFLDLAREVLHNAERCSGNIKYTIFGHEKQAKSRHKVYRLSSARAKKLEFALDMDADFWINLQANYNKELAGFEKIVKISSKKLEILKKVKPYFKPT